MPTEPREGDKLGNCRPGTVVDRTILVEQEFDFCKNEKFIKFFFFKKLYINYFIFFQSYNLTPAYKEHLVQYIIMFFMMKITSLQMEFKH